MVAINEVDNDGDMSKGKRGSQTIVRKIPLDPVYQGPKLLVPCGLAL